MRKYKPTDYIELDEMGFGRVMHQSSDDDIQKQITGSLMFQLVDQYGWHVEDAQRYIDNYLRMDSSRNFVKQLCKDNDLYDKRILEIGSGL